MNRRSRLRLPALTKLTSALVNTPLAFTSPMSTPIVADTLPVAPAESAAPVRVTGDILGVGHAGEVHLAQRAGGRCERD